MEETCEWPLIRASDEEVRDILLSAQTIAVVGVSRDPSKDSHIVAQYLSRYFNTYFVNPNADEIAGKKVYPSLYALPVAPDIVDIFRPPREVPEIVDAAIAIKARVIWMQLGIVHNEAARKALDKGLKVVMNRCLMVEHRRLVSEGIIPPQPKSS
ncbi:MAG: CoA-binding protein [Armatimonadetes bacterium]|nr:CoA-binding protein [Armatimonadota bacterium]MDW8120977.1 CoA-binding protein [Armatimonadota bacterium]